MTSIDQKKVARLRKALEGIWPHPNVFDSWTFTVTELAEVGDALLRNGYGAMEYRRNHEKEADLPGELADTYMMLATLATLLGVDLSLELDKRISQLYTKYSTDPRRWL